MILDNFAHLAAYSPILGESVCRQILAFLEKWDGQAYGSEVEIEGRRLLARCFRLPAKPRDECVFETHRKYHDVQCVIAGDEWIDWSPRQALRLRGDYDPAKDLQFFEPPDHVMGFPLEAGHFAFFSPEDAHRPQIRHRAEQVEKIVFKVDVSLTNWRA